MNKRKRDVPAIWPINTRENLFLVVSVGTPNFEGWSISIDITPSDQTRHCHPVFFYGDDLVLAGKKQMMKR